MLEFFQSSKYFEETAILDIIKVTRSHIRSLWVIDAVLGFSLNLDSSKRSFIQLFFFFNSDHLDGSS